MSHVPQKPTGRQVQPRFIAISEEYRALGLWVFPVSLDASRTPLFKWTPLQSRAPTAKELAGWYKRNRHANGAMPTGETTGIVVVDFDSVAALTYARERGLNENTWIVDTLGGHHYYFKHPGFRVKNSNGEVVKNLDIKGDGGSILCAGSENKRWAKGHSPADFALADLADLPMWICDHPALHHVEPTPAGPLRTYTGHTTKWARAALDGELDRLLVTGRGNRNGTLFRVSARLGSLIAAGMLDESEVRPALTQIADAWEDEDRPHSHNTIKRGLEAGKQRPAQAPERRIQKQSKRQLPVEVERMDKNEIDLLNDDPANYPRPHASAKVRHISTAPTKKKEKEKPKGPPPPTDADDAKIKLPFQCLGFVGGTYFFYSRSKRTLVELTTNAMKGAINLYPLASRYWWQKAFAGESARNDWIDVNRVANYLIEKCQEAGVYQEANAGCGFWIDNGRRVFHGGDYLIVDDEKKPLDLLDDSKRFYERGAHIDLDLSEPMSDKEAAVILALAKKFRWRNPLSGLFLAGWTVLAPVAGALDWRPHFWLVGASGAGKSEIIRLFVEPMIGHHIHTTDATAAGARAEIGNSALPFIYDEIEQEGGARSTRTIEQIDEIVRQMRSASTAQGSKSLRGTAGGGGYKFNVKSCYLFSSILATIKRDSDAGRITKAEVLLGSRAQWKGDREKQIVGLESEVIAACTREAGHRLIARTYRDLHILKANIATFGEAVATLTGDMRAGQQYGALLAGAAWLESTAEFTLGDAEDWLGTNHIDLSEHLRTETMGGTDSERLIAFLNQQIIRVACYDHVSRDFSIGELIRLARFGLNAQEEPARKDAKAILIRHGLKVVGDDIVVPHSHAELFKFLKDTGWIPWRDILSLHPGASLEHRTRGLGEHRVTRIPNWPDASTDEDEGEE